MAEKLNLRRILNRDGSVIWDYYSNTSKFHLRTNGKEGFLINHNGEKTVLPPKTAADFAEKLATKWNKSHPGSDMQTRPEKKAVKPKPEKPKKIKEEKNDDDYYDEDYDDGSLGKTTTVGIIICALIIVAILAMVIAKLVM